MAKSKAGLGVCGCCGESVVWKLSDTGSLSYTCQHCDFRTFAPKFSDACKKISAGFDVPPASTADPVPAPKAAPKADPAPAPKAAPKAKPAGIWDHLVKGGAPA